MAIHRTEFYTLPQYQTTTATAQFMYFDAAASVSGVFIPVDTIVTCEAKVTAHTTTAGVSPMVLSAAWWIHSIATNVGVGPSTLYGNANVVPVLIPTGLSGCGSNIVGGGDEISIYVQGLAATTINWNATLRLEITEVFG